MQEILNDPDVKAQFGALALALTNVVTFGERVCETECEQRFAICNTLKYACAASAIVRRLCATPGIMQTAAAPALTHASATLQRFFTHAARYHVK